MRTTGLVILRGRAQLHPLGFLAVRADRAHDKRPDLAAVQQALVRPRDIYRHLVVALCSRQKIIQII